MLSEKIIEVAFEITNKCNLRCMHCYNIKELDNSCKNELTNFEVKNLIDKFHELEIEKIKFGGGEPLIRDDFLDIYRYAVKKGFDCNFSSNGYILKEKLPEILKAGVDKVQVSLDSVGHKHDQFRNMPGLFQKVDNAVSKLKDNGIKINIATTFTTFNQHDMNLIYEFCVGHEVDRWKIMKYIPAGPEDSLMLSSCEYESAIRSLHLMKKEQERLGKDLKKPEIIVAREFHQCRPPEKRDYNDMQCFGGKSFFSLKANGNVTPCSYLPEYICGNVSEEELEKILDSDKMNEFALSENHNKEGQKCSLWKRCEGGCKAVSYKMIGKLNGCDSYCRIS